jgi:hypothetical protein
VEGISILSKIDVPSLKATIDRRAENAAFTGQWVVRLEKNTVMA